jgi:hypothetical protein
MMTMKVFRKVGDPATYRAVGHDGPRPIVAGLNTFSTNVPVSPGDVLGTNQPTSAATASAFSAPGDSHLFEMAGGNLADGQDASFQTFPDYRLNISAVVGPSDSPVVPPSGSPFVPPSNSFTLGRITRNKKKGTATITVNVPNPGELTGSGKGVKAASASRAVMSKSVAAGQAKLLIKATGKKKRKLNETGKVKLNVAITYTPTGGSPNTQSVKVKLKKRL